MMEFTNFSDVNAIVLAAPTVVLVIVALASAWMNRMPSRGKTANLEASEELAGVFAPARTPRLIVDLIQRRLREPCRLRTCVGTSRR